jgi:hypothetical protein
MLVDRDSRSPLGKRIHGPIRAAPDPIDRAVARRVWPKAKAKCWPLNCRPQNCARCDTARRPCSCSTANARHTHPASLSGLGRRSPTLRSGLSIAFPRSGLPGAVLNVPRGPPAQWGERRRAGGPEVDALLVIRIDARSERLSALAGRPAKRPSRRKRCDHRRSSAVCFRVSSVASMGLMGGRGAYRRGNRLRYATRSSKGAGP